MWVMGDEFARTQNGDDNPYDVDGPLTWLDWSRAAEWTELSAHVTALTALRRRHALASFQFFGVGPRLDESWDSHSVAWNSGDLYVMANAWWEPLTFEVQVPGPWRVAASTSPLTTTKEDPGANVTYTLAPRSMLVLER
jgi:glycogen operon protein